MNEKIYDKIVEVETSSIATYNGSHKVGDAIDMLKSSIHQFGIQNPIIIDKKNVVVAGEGVLLAAVELGYDKVPCVYVDDLTDEQVKQYRIADNKTSEFASWNEKKLRKELSYLPNPTELQPFFDSSILSMVDFYTPPAMNSATRKEEPVKVTTAEDLQKAKERELDNQKKFHEQLAGIEQAIMRKPCNFFEYNCGKCGKKVIVKISR